MPREVERHLRDEGITAGLQLYPGRIDNCGFVFFKAFERRNSPELRDRKKVDKKIDLCKLLGVFDPFIFLCFSIVRIVFQGTSAVRW